jgi:thiazolinyl imide reductase
MQLLLCGTNYGASYVQTLWSCPAGLRLAGILSRGSERSRALARQLGVSHFTALDSVPKGSIDAAIVAVPGEDGVALVMALLERGVHVLAEHPWEPQALEQAIGVAQTKKLVFHVNSHFGDLETVDLFLRHAGRGAMAPPVFLNLTVNTRTLYSAIDIAGRLLNTPQSLEFAPLQSPSLDTSSPAFFATVHGLIGSLPVAIHCQRFASLADDGSSTFVNHQVMLGFPDGNLMLGDTFGPLIWIPRLTPLTQWAQPVWSQLSTAPMESAGTYGAAVRERANRSACERFAAQISKGQLTHVQQPGYLLGVSRAWRRILNQLWAPASKAEATS